MGGFYRWRRAMEDSTKWDSFDFEVEGMVSSGKKRGGKSGLHGLIFLNGTAVLLCIQGRTVQDAKWNNPIILFL